MGKKGKRSKKESLSTNNTDFVTILTPTVKKREECIKILAEDCINKQTYLSQIKQWVIVSADKNWNEEDFNKFIETVKSLLTKPEIVDSVYITDKVVKERGWPEVENYEAIGYLRNITNLMIKHDYIICMDDDDYYPPKRVEHAVTSLKKSSYEMAGCSGHIMYETDIKSLYQFKRFNQNHSVNNSFAYKKSLIDSGTSSYNSTLKHAEEKDFLNNYTVPMVQLDPLYTIVQMVHFQNTYNKRHLLISAEWMDPKRKNINKINVPPSKFIPQTVIDKYRKALKYEDESKSKYDIVYYTGLGAPKWSPYDIKLGGSEQAVKHLVESWTKLGYSVAVYGEFDDDVINKTKNDQNTGDYLHFSTFKCSDTYNTLILWRKYGTHPLMSWNLKANKIYIDLHDNIPLTDSCLDNLNNIDQIFVKSQYHLDNVSSLHKSFNLSNKMTIIKNGVRVSDFTPDNTIERDPYRFCWCSCYKRGLGPLLAWCWPIIYKYEPKASFHIYYGMDGIGNTEGEKKFKETMVQLLKQPGVVDHGRRSVSEVITEKHTSTFHLYYSRTTAETDCISIRESLCAGCIPIISEYNVFKERDGIKLPGDPQIQDNHHRVAQYILELFKNPDEIKKIQDRITGIEDNWDDIAKLWPLEK